MSSSRSGRNVAPVRPPSRKRRVKLRRPETIFAILALLVVCSLVVTLVGTSLVDVFTEANEDDPIEFSDGDRDEFEQSLRDEVAANPDDPNALKNLASYLSNIGKLEEAIEYYERALAINPSDATLRLAFADALANGGKRPDAELQYRKAIEVQPNNPLAHYGLAELYRMWSPPRLEEAILEYQETINVGADSYVAELAARQLATLSYGTPSPIASPELEATP